MRIVKTTHANKGGKNRQKATLKRRDELKTKAVAKVMENMTAQAKKIEADAFEKILTDHLKRTPTREDAAKCKMFKIENEPGKMLFEYDGLKLGIIERQHHKEKQGDNYRVLFTPFETPELKVA